MTSKRRKMNGLLLSGFLCGSPSILDDKALRDIDPISIDFSALPLSFISNQHALNILEMLNKQRSDPDLCDYEVHVNERIFFCHKCVLIGVSDFFKAMLTGSMKESRENFVVLKGFTTCEGIDQILNFVYSGEINLSFGNILNILLAASQLQVAQIIELCSEYLIKNLNYSNVVYVLKIADTFMLTQVLEVSQKFLCENFADIYEHGRSQFVQLSFEQLKWLLTSDGLNEFSELDLFLMIVKWISKDSSRIKYASELMKLIRFMCMKPEEICDHVEKVNFMHSIPECSKQLMDAYRWHALPNRQPLYDTEQTRLRTQQVLVAVGETNIYVLNEMKAKWETVSNAPLDENYPYPFSVITINNYLYVFGTRRSSSEEYRACYRFSPRTLKWTQLSPFLRDRSRFGIAFINGHIYVFGGFEGFKRSNRVYLNTIDRYSLENDSWEEFSSDGPVMSCMACCSKGNIIYFGGGKNMNWSKVSDFYSIDVIEKRMEKKAKLLSARTTHQIAVVDDCIYTLGGFDDAGNGILNIEAYSIKNDQWSIVTSIPGKISKTWPQSLGVLSNSRLYISVFTTPNTFKITQKGYYYDIITNVWSDAPVIAERARYCPTSTLAFPPQVYNFENKKILSLKHDEDANQDDSCENNNLPGSDSFQIMYINNFNEDSNFFIKQ